MKEERIDMILFMTKVGVRRRNHYVPKNL